MQSIFYKFRTTSFLLLCLVLGGTSQFLFAPKLVVYSVSMVIIFCTLWKIKLSHILAKPIVLVLAIFIGHSFLQLIPFPPFVWTAIPGREVIIESYHLIGETLPWQPLSMAPEKTIFSIANVLPPIAIYFLVVHWSDRHEQDAAMWWFLMFATFTVLIGFAQKALPNGPLHFYGVTNETLAVGFFSNANHQATLLLMAIPFAFAFVHNSFRQDHSQRKIMSYITVIALSMILTFTFGLIINTSVAGYMLMILAIILSALLFSNNIRRSFNLKICLLSMLIVPFVGIVLYDASNSVLGLGTISEKLAINGEMSRGHIYRQTLEIIPDYFMFGAGLGAYPDVYRLYETTSNVSRVFVPHAHNDYLEIMVDMGLLGGVMIIAFWLWWAQTLLNLLRNGRRTSAVAKAASLAILLVLLHSFVDYPLRTIAIGTLFGFSLGLMVRRNT